MKLMKYTVSFALCVNLCLYSKEVPQSTSSKPEQVYDEITQVVISNFANIVNCFFNIVQDPNNPQNIGENATNILGGIVNIALTAAKNGELSLDASQDEIDAFIQKLEHELRTKLVKLMLKLKLEKQQLETI